MKLKTFEVVVALSSNIHFSYQTSWRSVNE
jgi:hypothetical protein